MPLPKAVAFDIDNTLCESKQPLSSEMAALVSKLLGRTYVAVTSGAKFSLAKEQIADPVDASLRSNLFILPTSGAAFFHYADGAWVPLYEELLSEEENHRIA